MAYAAAGWYSDPSGSASWRFWDGNAWTNHTSSEASVPVTAPAGAVMAAPPAAAAPIADALPAQPYGQPAYGQQAPWTQQQQPQHPYGQPGYQPVGYGQAHGAPMQRLAATGWRKNQYAFYTFGIVAIYLVIAFYSRIVLIGFLPLGMSLRSQRSREQLAPVAIAAAIISLVVGLLAFSGR